MTRMRTTGTVKVTTVTPGPLPHPTSHPGTACQLTDMHLLQGDTVGSGGTCQVTCVVPRVNLPKKYPQVGGYGFWQVQVWVRPMYLWVYLCYSLRMSNVQLREFRINMTQSAEELLIKNNLILSKDKSMCCIPLSWSKLIRNFCCKWQSDGILILNR